MRYLARKRAQQAMEELTLVMTRLPEQYAKRDFARIFGDGETYWAMVEACSKAYDIGIVWSMSDELLQHAFMAAGLGYHSKRELTERSIRDKLTEQLLSGKGQPFFLDCVKERGRETRQLVEITIEKNKRLLGLMRQLHERWRKEETERPLEKGA